MSMAMLADWSNVTLVVGNLTNRRYRSTIRFARKFSWTKGKNLMLKSNVRPLMQLVRGLMKILTRRNNGLKLKHLLTKRRLNNNHSSKCLGQRFLSGSSNQCSLDRLWDLAQLSQRVTQAVMVVNNNRFNSSTRS